MLIFAEVPPGMPPSSAFVGGNVSAFYERGSRVFESCCRFRDFAVVRLIQRLSDASRASYIVP